MTAFAAKFTGATLACEPTGYGWKVVGELAAAADNHPHWLLSRQPLP